MTGIDVVVMQAGEGGSVVGSALAFVVSFLVGTVGIYAGARVLIDRDTAIQRAAITALLGAIVWAVVGFFFGWIPLLGPLLTLIVWIGVINWQYPGGWVNAIGIGVVAWIVAFVILYVLGILGLAPGDVLGIPGI